MNAPGAIATQRLVETFRPQGPVLADLIDGLIEVYCDWREACAAVHTAYDSLSGAVAADRALAFAAYAAALDREAAASRCYGDQVKQVSQMVLRRQCISPMPLNPCPSSD